MSMYSCEFPRSGLIVLVRAVLTRFLRVRSRFTPALVRGSGGLVLKQVIVTGKWTGLSGLPIGPAEAQSIQQQLDREHIRRCFQADSVQQEEQRNNQCQHSSKQAAGGGAAADEQGGAQQQQREYAGQEPGREACERPDLCAAVRPRQRIQRLRQPGAQRQGRCQHGCRQRRAKLEPQRVAPAGPLAPSDQLVALVQQPLGFAAEGARQPCKARRVRIVQVDGDLPAQIRPQCRSNPQRLQALC
ncbi:hypothetical protein [Paenibacillus sp. CAA11]|uniref:hypothetical protein n=1 Tax=Paenibacillus sp. CAA11 TaxID=1532905 RepID=UPI00131F4471|nr:hypothetical protein [Paenibacillus sp. CAA11]